MKNYFASIAAAVICFLSLGAIAQTKENAPILFIDVHHLGAGKVKYSDVAAAHKKDLAVENKYHVNFIKFWVDEKRGNVYCLSTAPDSASIAETHKEAHGLLPDQVLEVSPGMQADIIKGKDFYLDIHYLGAGKVTAADVAGAHKKDLAVQDKYNVNFINYWVDVKSGTVVCLSQAPDSSAVIATHKEAHGLLPNSISKVEPGQ